MENLLLGVAILFIENLRIALFYALFFWVIMSWFTQTPSGFGIILNKIVEPIVYLFRWAKIGMFDFSPIIAIMVINYGGDYLVKFLKSLA
jgi:uncharacterized protein YggT (Ycf19 family)